MRAPGRPTGSGAPTTGPGRRGGEPDPPSVRDGLQCLERLLAILPLPGDARYYGERWLTLRAANSQLYQPQLERYEAVSLRLVEEGGRVGSSTTTDLSEPGLTALVQEARTLARWAPRSRVPFSFPKDPSSPLPPLPFSPAVLTDGTRPTEALRRAIHTVSNVLPGARVSGAFHQGYQVLAVANSSGLRRGYRRGVAQASLLCEDLSRDPPASGWAERAGWDPGAVDWDGLGQEALAATPRAAAGSVPPGSYRVLLAPSAVRELLGSLFLSSLGAHAVEEGWSFLCEPARIPEIPSLLEMKEDPLSPAGLPEPMDAEGTARRRRVLLRDGVFSGPCHDLASAARTSARSTGNALPPEMPGGPIPTHLSLRPGKADRQGLLTTLGRGVLVTRFWYVRTVHPGRTEITGMTRDGTYWVENGSIAYPVRNLRFTQSVLATLAQVEAVGKESRAVADERGLTCLRVSPLVSGDFHFTSGTSY